MDRHFKEPSGYILEVTSIPGGYQEVAYGGFGEYHILRGALARLIRSACCQCHSPSLVEPGLLRRCPQANMSATLHMVHRLAAHTRPLLAHDLPR